MTRSIGYVLLLFITSAVVAHAQSITVTDAVELALSAGDIAAADLAVEEARGELEQRLVLPNPTIELDHQDVFDRGIAPGFTQDLLKLEQSLLTPARRRARRAVGLSGVRRATWEAALARRKKVHEVRRAFVDVLESQEVLRVREASLTRVHSAQRAIELRVKGGESSRYEQARIALALSQERDAIHESSSDLARARTELARAVGRSLPAERPITGTLPSQAPDAGTLAQLVRAADLPEIAVEQAREAVARADERLARAESRPAFTVAGGYLRFDQTAIPSQDGYNAIVAVELPLHDRRTGERRAARARAEAAHRSGEAARDRASAELDAARREVEVAAARVTQLDEGQGPQVRPLMEMAETAYREGLQSLLELLDAQRAERDFRIARVRARAALARALETVAFASGRDPDALVKPTRGSDSPR